MTKIKYIIVSFAFLIMLGALMNPAYAAKPDRPEYATIELVQQMVDDLRTELTTYIDGHVATLQGVISALTTRVDQNEVDIDANAAYIMLLELRITALENILAGTNP